MTGENIRANVDEELAAAHEALDAAAANEKIGQLKTAVNRLYYAAYHAGLAVCLSEGIEPKTHRGLSHLLQLHFVKPGKLPGWVQSELSVLQTNRDLADYEPGYRVSVDDYQRLRATTDRLISELEAFLKPS